MGAAFDPAGNLWTADDGGNRFVELTTAQLAAAGNSYPRIVNWVGGTVSPFFNPRAVAFDASGTLWLINRHVGNNTLEGFTQAQLSAGGSQAAAMTIVLPDSFVRALAFDANGNLWVPSFDGQHVAKYTLAQLAAGGSPTPAVSIGVPHPTGLAFDASGNLWVVDAVDGQLFELASSQLTASGTPIPATTMPLPVASNSFDPQQPFFLVFNPHASNLPLGGSRVVSRPHVNAASRRR
jgi:sugar lactone lactonase YvrE